MANMRICVTAAVFPSLKQNSMSARRSNCDISNERVNFVSYRHDYGERGTNAVLTIKLLQIANHV